MNYEKFLNLADANSLESNCSKYNIGAVIFRRQSVLGEGTNHYTSRIPKQLYSTHPRSSKWNCIHAEMAALKEALRSGSKINGTCIAVSGFTKAGARPISTRPCRNCLRVLSQFGVRQVIYRTRDGFHISNIRDMDLNKICSTSCNQEREQRET